MRCRLLRFLHSAVRWFVISLILRNNYNVIPYSNVGLYINCYIFIVYIDNYGYLVRTCIIQEYT